MNPVQNNQKQTGGGEGREPDGLPTFESGLYLLKGGFAMGFVQHLAVGSQTFQVIFCHVVIPQGATVQLYAVKYSMLICLMGSGIRSL